MAKVRLTIPKVEAFACPPGKDQAFLWDADTPGLGLRVTAGGARARPMIISQAPLSRPPKAG